MHRLCSTLLALISASLVAFAAAQVPELGAPGLSDIALYNAMGDVANGIGNHEFDVAWTTSP